MRKLNMLIN